MKRLTTHTHQDTALRLLKKFNNPSLKYIWRFHREVTPTRVVSIRVSEGYLAPEEPKFGNRMMVHALVRFDTEQVRRLPSSFRSLFFVGGMGVLIRNPTVESRGLR